MPDSRISFAVSNIESSTRDDPTSWPEAFKKVLVIPPPTMMKSVLSFRLLISPSLDETLAPPIIAKFGLGGF